MEHTTFKIFRTISRDHASRRVDRECTCGSCYKLSIEHSFEACMQWTGMVGDIYLKLQLILNRFANPIFATNTSEFRMSTQPRRSSLKNTKADLPPTIKASRQSQPAISKASKTESGSKQPEPAKVTRSPSNPPIDNHVPKKGQSNSVVTLARKGSGLKETKSDPAPSQEARRKDSSEPPKLAKQESVLQNKKSGVSISFQNF